MLWLACFLFPRALNQILWLLVKEYFFPLLIKPSFSYFGNISVVTSRNSKSLRKSALLFNIEHFDSWDNFLVAHPRESKLLSL